MNTEYSDLLAFKRIVIRLLAANLFVLGITCFLSFMSFKEANEASSNGHSAKIMAAQLKYRLVKKGIIEKMDDMSTAEGVKEIQFLSQEPEHKISNY
ncbi:hypothetical protein [Adhaeribacter rhizoryzae]|uniref:Uncharacterized protein n=1 Tax=Adhaeribacter rhizoryzae TaxID=2607907 RepID=A0A5M6DNU5_9BACT|nr:hypothetical protein [Adhaeribacter rhizoryzae]KAA5549211.1 hypothetical protein F0145_01055 [Adhaeribacter rhizoryzae]